MSSWHETKETWSTVDESDVAFVVEDRLPDWGLTKLGRRVAAQQLTERGVTPEEIADLVGVTPRTVWRWRSDGFRQAAA